MKLQNPYTFLFFYLIRTIKNQIKKVIYYFGQSLEFAHHVHYFMINRIEFFWSMSVQRFVEFVVWGGSVIWSTNFFIRLMECTFDSVLATKDNSFQIETDFDLIFFFANRSIVNLLMSIVHQFQKPLGNLYGIEDFFAPWSMAMYFCLNY